MIVLAVQQIEGHVLQPFLLGRAVSVHPVAVVLSVATGSLVAGVVGALLAVPFVATLNTMTLYLHGHDKFPELGSNAPGLERRLLALSARAPDGAAAPAGSATQGGPAEEDAPAGAGPEASGAENPEEPGAAEGR